MSSTSRRIPQRAMSNIYSIREAVKGVGQQGRPLRLEAGRMTVRRPSAQSDVLRVRSAPTLRHPGICRQAVQVGRR